MASRLSQRRSASVIDLQTVQRVLQDGAILEAPHAITTAAVVRLEELGIIDALRASFVRCSNRLDPDYPPPVRDCLGHIRLHADDDRGVCPECGRDVDLRDPDKQRYEGLEIHIKGAGVMAYLAGAAKEFGTPVQSGAGVLRFRGEPADVYLCVAELCDGEHRRRRDTAATDPTVVVTLEPTSPDRVLQEPWLIRTTLAAIVTGEVDLKRILQAAADQGRPTTLINASVPIYAGGVRPIVARPPETPLRQFVLRITHDQAHLEGVLIASRKAPAQLLVLQILAKHFMRSLISMTSMTPGLLSADHIADRLQRLTKKEREDRESVRKSINRLQDTIADRIKRTLGLPIGREDIIETVPWQGQQDPYGYRLNPLSVMIGHNAGCMTQLSE